jgi:hypothetical protein
MPLFSLDPHEYILYTVIYKFSLSLSAHIADGPIHCLRDG